MESIFGIESVEKCGDTPEKNNQEGDIKREGEELFSFDDEYHDTKERDTDTEELRKGECDIKEGKSKKLRRVVKRHADDDKTKKEEDGGLK